MLIDIQDISQGRVSFIDIETEIGPDERSESYLGNSLAEPPIFQGRLAAAGRGVLTLTGRLRTAVTGICARCLKPVHHALDIRVDERYRSSTAAQADGPDDSYPYNGRTVDLLPALRDNLVLAIPARLLCKDNCQGICARCGADLNEKACNCEVAGAEADSPFSKLKELL